MNFYYDPILGLQYDYLDNIVLIELTEIPEIKMKSLIKMVREIGLLPFNADCNVTYEIHNITSYKIR